MLRFIWILVAAIFLLAGCAPALPAPVGPSIVDIHTSDTPIHEGQVIWVNVRYENNDPTNTYSNVYLYVTPGLYLNYVEAKPEPTEMDCAETCSLVWYIGDMSPGYYESVDIKFRVADPPIDPTLYSLTIGADLRSLTLEGTPEVYQYYGKELELYFYDRFTPAAATDTTEPTATLTLTPSPMPTSTPSPTLTFTPTPIPFVNPDTAPIFVAVISAVAAIVVAVITAYATLRVAKEKK